MPTAATFDHFLRQLKEQLVDHPYEDEIIKLAFEQLSDDLDDADIE